MIGVYVITNEVTGEQYVGASQDVRARFNAHKRDLRQGEHFNKRLQTAWDTYGEAAFSFEGLEKGPDINIWGHDRDQKVIQLRAWLNQAEARWMRKLNPAYNIKPPLPEDIPMRIVS